MYRGILMAGKHAILLHTQCLVSSNLILVFFFFFPPIWESCSGAELNSRFQTGLSEFHAHARSNCSEKVIQPWIDSTAWAWTEHALSNRYRAKGQSCSPAGKPCVLEMNKNWKWSTNSFELIIYDDEGESVENVIFILNCLSQIGVQKVPFFYIISILFNGSVLVF